MGVALVDKNSSRIFWFSGTGNSLYAAKYLAAKLGASLSQITDAAPDEPVGGEDAVVGVVFPSYYCNMPRAVYDFVQRLEIKPDTYVFAIVTMGGPGQGSVAAIKKALAAKGLSLSYGRGLKMPSNNVLLYNPAEPEKAKHMADEIKQNLQNFGADIKNGKRLIKSHPFIMHRHFKNISKIDAPFAADDNCISCKFCEKICPVRNIKLENGKPQWLGHCQMCVACISWCPKKSINYGEKTKSRRRYCNPNIKSDEIKMAANNRIISNSSTTD